MTQATETNVIEKEIVLRAPRSRVWSAIADAEKFGQWFGMKLDGAFTSGQEMSGKFTNPKYAHITLYMTIVASRISGFLFSLFAILLVTFAFLTLGEFGGSSAMTHIGGYLGLVTAMVAWYGSFAGVYNASVKRVVMPTWPR